MTATMTAIGHSWKPLTGLVTVLFLTSGLAHARDVQLIVDFRDGTVLRLAIPDGPLPWRRISEIGEVTDEPVQLSRVEQLRFVVTPATAQVARVRQMVTRLGADDFHSREEAQEELIQRGAKFRKIVEQSLPRATDFEVRWRLRQIIAALPESEGLFSNDYDQLTLQENGDELHGDVGDWSVELPYRGSQVTINRKTVLAVRNAPLDFDLAAEPPIAIITRIAKDEDAQFPSDVTRIDFDRGPAGESIKPGTDISETYVALGCTFATSIPNSYVAIEPYNVGGRSGKRCAATHKPLYQGTITIRFCKPGNARLPAGVKYVGFWTSHIAPEGTALQAFDARDRKIAEIKTRVNQRDFLSLSSNVPIAYIKVVPDVDIDPDYAIDDLVFDTPQPLSEAGDPDRYSLVLMTGERLHCRGLEKHDDTLLLQGVTVGIDKLKVKVSDVAVLVPPRSPLADVTDDQRCYVRMADGTILRARGGEGLELDRFADLAIDTNRVVALWGARTTVLELDGETKLPEQGAVILSESEKAADPVVQLNEWKLGPRWIESPELRDKGFNAQTYAGSPTIWFRKPNKRPPGTGLLRTSSGEEIVLGSGEGFQLKSWNLDGVTVAHGKRAWTIPLSDVRSLLLPR